MEPAAHVTERLILRPFTAADAAAIQWLNSDPETVRFMWPNTPWTHDDATTWLTTLLARYATTGVGSLGVYRKTDDQLIGRAGLATWVIAGDYEVGYLLGRDFWGQGYALEAAQALRDHAFRTYDLPRVISMIDVLNVRSQNVARRNGMTPGEPQPWYEGIAQVWSITRETWESTAIGHAVP